MSQNRKKILIVTPYYYPEGGGQEHYAYQVAQNCSEYDFHVATLSREPEKQEGQIHRYKADLVVSNTPIKFSFLFKLLKLIKQEKFDLIHAHTPVPFAMDCAAIASKLTKTPLVITYHSAKLLKDKFFIDLIIRAYILIEKFTLKLFKTIITVSPHIKKGKNNQVIFPGVDLDKFKYQEYTPGNNLFFICPLKKAYSNKGLDVLLKALVEVKNKNIDFTLNIAGDKGDAYQYYQQKTKELNLEDNINFLGRLNQAEMIEQYQQNQITLITSLANTEGMPTIMFEAGAIGRPIIASNTSGIPYFIEDNKNGLLFEPGNSQELSEKIASLLQNQELTAKMGEEAYNKAQDYSWQKIGQKYAQVYQENIS